MPDMRAPLWAFSDDGYEPHNNASVGSWDVLIPDFADGKSAALVADALRRYIRDHGGVFGVIRDA